MKRDDYCVFILTHGRPDNVITYDVLMESGFTGNVFIVIDDEDKTGNEYRKRFGSKVIEFNKTESLSRFDKMDNFDKLPGVVCARSVCRDMAINRGFKYFIELDDDYPWFSFRHSHVGYSNVKIKTTMDDVFSAMVSFLEKSGAQCISMSQGGDHIGGSESGLNKHGPQVLRKMMNVFVLSTEKKFNFFGRLNEDVNAYASLSRSGGLFITLMQLMITQKQTQTNPGGMSEIYLDLGTYVKSFYSVMCCPSSVKVVTMGDPRAAKKNLRIHHKVKWDTTYVKILSVDHKKKALDNRSDLR